MATPCPYTVQLIGRDEFIGDSLEKINSNFTALASAACNLEQYIQNKTNIRTFFYYGPNSTFTPTIADIDLDMDGNSPTYPNNNTIQTFVNSVTGLNLLPISKLNDEAYVVYQKTGWVTTQTPYTATGTGSAPYEATVQVPIVRTIGIGRRRPVVVGYETRVETRYASYSWTENVDDINRNHSPNFIVYRLVHDGVDYKVNNIRFVRAQTANTINWNNPKIWITY
jgi:hypothetical protein